MRTIQVRDAKSTFSALVKAAEQGEPTTITRHGRPAAVVVPVEAASRIYADEASNFADFLLTFPGLPEEFERDRVSTRSVDL